MSKPESNASWQSSITSAGATKAEAASGNLKWALMVSLAVALVLFTAYTSYISIEPDMFDVAAEAQKTAKKQTPEELPNGYIYGNTLAKIGETLLTKNGGYLSNDLFPGPLIDNMPAWEFGVLVMLRDGATALRNQFSRSQSQSKENFRLSEAEPHFYYDNSTWFYPTTEGEYKAGIDGIRNYLKDLNNPQVNTANFYPRADNLDQYIQVIVKRLGDYSFRLSASSVKESALVNQKGGVARTPWMEVDNVFWEARGATWAMLHLFKAIEADFQVTLRGKAATLTLRQIIRELEEAQAPILSPVILNGDGFGLFANYSLTMANHISRANAAAFELRELMLRG